MSVTQNQSMPAPPNPATATASPLVPGSGPVPPRRREDMVLFQKATAAGLHFLLGLAVLLPIVAWIRHRYYPGPLFWTDGGWQGLRIVLGVDLVLGPLLTFIVFRASKTRQALTLDFGVIIALQVLALAWGLHAIAGNRPWVLAHRGGDMYALPRRVFADQQLPANAWAAFGDGPPYRVAVHAPTTSEEIIGAGMFEVTNGLQPFELYFLYRPFGSRALPKARPGEAPATDRRLKEAVNIAGGSAHAHIVRLNGSYRPAYVVFDDQGHVTGWALVSEEAS